MWPDNTTNQTNAAPQYSNGGNARATASSLSPSMPLDELAKQLESASARVSSLSDRIRSVADSLFGSQPESKAGGINAPPISGRVNGLNSQAGTIHFWLNELEQQVARLNPLG